MHRIALGTLGDSGSGLTKDLKRAQQAVSEIWECARSLHDGGHHKEIVDAFKESELRSDVRRPDKQSLGFLTLTGRFSICNNDHPLKDLLREVLSHNKRPLKDLAKDLMKREEKVARDATGSSSTGKEVVLSGGSGDTRIPRSSLVQRLTSRWGRN